MERSIVKRVVSILAASSGALLLAATAAPPTHAQDAGPVATRTVVVIVESLRSDHGELAGGLYTSARVWLGPDRAASNCHAPIRHGRARCVFEVPATSRFAFAAMHDEDGDGQLDRDMIGLPQEGYAFSNDVREPFGPPSFDAASFTTAGTEPFVVHARYGI